MLVIFTCNTADCVIRINYNMLYLYLARKIHSLMLNVYRTKRFISSFIVAFNEDINAQP